MSTDEPSSLDRTFAAMLGELEDEATRLTQKHDALVREADEIAGELERVEAVRAAMMGKPKPAKRKSPKAPAATPAVSDATALREQRVRRIQEFARANGGTFTGRQAADAIGMAFQGVGPVLAGMVRRGEATAQEPEGNGPRIYTLAA